MSTLKVEVVQIDKVDVHPNADRLELAQVKGWNVVVGKGNFQTGETAIYFPVDSVLPEDLELHLFPADSKIKLNKHRIRSIKIRGAMSQGMLVPVWDLEQWLQRDVDVGEDVTELLGVVKYEPPEPHFSPNPRMGKKTGGKAQVNPHFHKYTDIENVKNYHTIFQDGEPVYISEKLHGTSARYGWVPRFYGPGLLGAIKTKVMSKLEAWGLVSPYQFVYGSRNVQLQNGTNKSWYSDDPYTKILNQENIKNKLKPGECIYGEIVGDRIQKNYNYGCGPGEHQFYAYDVMKDGRWLNHAEFAAFCDTRGFKRVPELYVGPYSKEIELAHRDGDSTIGGQKIREGVVIKPQVEEVSICGRKVLKSISDAYYLEDNDDFH